jgi:GTP-binding protein
VKIPKAQFIKSATASSHYPAVNLPEIAFAGRSNVGKSSLINTLVGQKGLARTSNTPGRTRLINFYDINETWCFVDLPGYGYARVSEEERRAWGPMVETYLQERRTLRLVLLILDIRREPGEHDLTFRAWLVERGFPFRFVLTKSDKLSRMQLLARKGEIARMLGLPLPGEPIVFSAKTGAGREDIWRVIKEHSDSFHSA